MALDRLERAICCAQVEEGLRSQLRMRSAALADANARFSELEAVMRRMAARSAAGAS
jgi:hypothetical protein